MLKTTVCGIPCQVEVNYYFHKPPDYNNDASDVDYYGYTDTDFTLYDSKGYKAPWLEKKMTEEDMDKLKEEIICYVHDKSYVY